MVSLRTGGFVAAGDDRFREVPQQIVESLDCVEDCRQHDFARFHFEFDSGRRPQQRRTSAARGIAGWVPDDQEGVDFWRGEEMMLQIPNPCIIGNTRIIFRQAIRKFR